MLKKLLLSGSVFGLTILGLSGQVVINEYSAANYSDIADNYGEYEDWIELYNAGATAVDLSGYHLSDRIGSPTKYTIPPGVNISAGGYLRFWCSNRNTAVGTNYHTNFKLTQTTGAEDVVFADAAGTVLDTRELNNPNQTNHSWGRYPNGGADWKIFTDPTPNASNSTTPKTAYAHKPDMEPNSGNFAGSVTVTITAPEPGMTIRYTTNGNLPTAASTAYTGPITITETTVLRTVAFAASADTLASFCSTNTYFIDETTTMPVISVAGDQVDDLLNATGWGIEPVGSFELFDKDFNLIDEAVGDFNEHGNDSWAYDQRGFDFIVRDQFGYDNDIDQTFFNDVTDREGYQRLIVKAAANDNYPSSSGGAHVRDAFVHHISGLDGLELDERSTFFNIMFLNGDYWGVYDTREKADDADYTDYYYGQGEYEMDYIKCWGGTWAEYGTMAPWSPFVTFVTTNDMTIPANYDYVKDNFNTMSLIDYVLTNTFSVCTDWLNWNTAWWRGYDATGSNLTWRYALWDEDATFGHYINYTGVPDDSPTASPCDPLTLGGVDPNGHIDMLNSLLDNPDFHSDYINRFADLINTTFSCEVLLPRIDSMRAVLDPEMTRHTDKWGGTYTGWSNNYDELHDFIAERCAYLPSGVEDCFDVTAYGIVVKIEPAGSPNDVRVSTIIPDTYPYSATYFSGTTLGFQAIADPAFTFDHWEFINHVPSPSTTDDSVTVSLTTTDTIIAWFAGSELPMYDFTLDIDPPGAGVATVEGFSPAAYPYAGAYESGTFIDLSATPTGSYVLDYWSLENHTANPDPFAPDIFFALSDIENAVAHFRLKTSVEENGVSVSMTAVPSVTAGPVQVHYGLSAAQDNMQLTVYSLTGQLIADLGADQLISGAQGEHIVSVDLNQYHLANGMYFIRLTAGNQSINERVMLAK
ncbi:MAG TPA: CotH kinase family protein [Chitinophagales bacterium]|nr:CotH kinase family protein [Chitinophagales bacterium]HNJ89229.1 CotH kinase family protein [Chitinophagales bacterium]HNK97304.1 CotH kinase family protein [Chitinophagales bacterium]